MLPAKVLVPLTTKLDVPVLLVMAGLVPLMLKLPTVMARCKSKVALLMVSAVVVTPALPPMLPVLVTLKVPPLTVVAPAYVLAADKVKVPKPSLVSVPLVVAITPVLITVLPTPPTVNGYVAPVIPPVSVCVLPVSALILAPLAPKVMAPA